MSTKFSHVLKASVGGNSREEITANLMMLMADIINRHSSNCRDEDSGFDYDIVEIPEGGDFAGVDCSEYKMADKF